MPEPHGNPVTISAFMDANHAGNVIMCHLHIGILIFACTEHSNHLVSTFGSKLVANRICKELIVALQYKLQMFGVPIDGPVNVFCDNRGVVKNLSIPESTLLKKHNAIKYHAVREVVAAGILCVGKEDMMMNLADMLTKVMTTSGKCFASESAREFLRGQL